MQKQTTQRKPLLAILILLVLLLAASAVAVTYSRIQPASSLPEEATASPAPTGIPAFTASSLADGMTEKQRSSINMLNHLVVLTQEINNARNSRLYLEEAYSALVNNVSPEAVDVRTQTRIEKLLEELVKYQLLAAKRDRLLYIYEQNKAQAIRDTVPSAESMVTAILSMNPAKLVGSIVYMAADSYASYESGMAAAELQYLQEGWALTDEEQENLHQLRSTTLSYTFDIIRDYSLPGSLALTEDSVSAYVKWKGESNNLQRIQYFEDEAATYQAFGPYWLTLADCYYQNGDYLKCLRALATYEALDVRIFRRDYSLAAVLPLGIAAAGEVLENDQYVETAARYAALIIDNTDSDDWALRFFAAQTYADLFSRTQDYTYLRAAYNTTLSNVNCLIGKQKEFNAAYLDDVQLQSEEPGMNAQQKADLKKYNALLTETRKTELPPLYEPLLLNCELLFALADKLGVDEAERQRVDGILHENGSALFLVGPVDAACRLTPADPTLPQAEEITLNGKEIILPARYVSDTSVISLTVTCGGETRVFTDWTVRSTARPDKADPATFTVTYRSPELEKYDYQPDAAIHIEVLSHPICPAAGSCDYKTVATKNLLVFNGVGLERVAE